VTAPSHRTALDDVAIADLSRHFRGALIRPGDASYDAERRIWNGAIDRRPALIARCTGAGDVRAAVRFARERELVQIFRRFGSCGVARSRGVACVPRLSPGVDAADRRLRWRVRS
jgi:hypothetical protein